MEFGAEAPGVTIRRAAAGMNRGAIAAAAVLLLGMPDARAQDGSWFEQETATGNWGGGRQRLVEGGVTPQASYTTDLLAKSDRRSQAGLRLRGGVRSLARVRPGEAARPQGLRLLHRR